MSLLPAPTTTQTHFFLLTMQHTNTHLLFYMNTHSEVNVSQIDVSPPTTCEQIFTPLLDYKKEENKQHKTFPFGRFTHAADRNVLAFEGLHQCFCTFLSLKMQRKSRD